MRGKRKVSIRPHPDAHKLERPLGLRVTAGGATFSAIVRDSKGYANNLCAAPESVELAINGPNGIEQLQVTRTESTKGSVVWIPRLPPGKPKELGISVGGRLTAVPQPSTETVSLAFDLSVQPYRPAQSVSDAQSWTDLFGEAQP